MLLHFSSERTKASRQVRARAAVLGLPKAALDKLSLRGRGFEGPEGARFQAYKDAVEPVPIQRVYASYPYPWWQRAGVTSGPGVTTAPIRLTFALDTQGTQPDAPNPDDQHSLFLVAFNELEEELEPGSKAAVLQEESEQQQVRELYGLESIPKPVEQARKVWGRNTIFGGAWHRWRPGYESEAVGRCMRKPFERLRLHVIGEAYSEVQGWTEGALATSEEMLREYYGLEWLPQSTAR
jgi:monoamine oxidase